MTVDAWVFVSIGLFYVLITIIGIWSARLERNRKNKRPADALIIGNRDIGLILGICTLTASWIGGGALNGTAETVYSSSLGLVWCMPPVAAGLSVIIGGLFFSEKLRDKKCMTVLDPIEEKLGRRFVAMYVVFEMMGNLMYTSAVLNALGGTLEVIAGISRAASIISSAAIATLYTLLGGIYSVAYTDVVQLAFIVIGLLVAIPSAFSHEAVSSIGDSFFEEGGWSGKVNPDDVGPYIDAFMATLVGAVPIQALFQRFLAMDTTTHAKIVSVVSGIFIIILLIPPVLIGAIGASTNWNLTRYYNGSGVSPADLGDEIQILPLVVQYLTPPAVRIFGLGAITAAVMSSADAAGLAFGAVFGKNLYNTLLRPKASQREVIWAIRASIVVFGIASAAIALQVKSIMVLYILAPDLVYVLTLPQFICSVYFDSNAYGSICGIIVGVILRIGGGEYLLDIPGPFNYVGGNTFPVKTVAMLSTFVTTGTISYVVRWLFRKQYVPKRYDLFKAFHQQSDNGLSIDKATLEATTTNV